jgi:DNA-binding CsgD family transcriptional regulator
MPKRNWASCAQKKNCAACDADHMPPKAVWRSLILAHAYAREFSDEGGEVGLGPDRTNVAIHESSLLCTVSKERGRDMAQIALLKDKFGLTPAESRLVLRIVAGVTLRLSAAGLGIGYETARTTLKTVFRKTGTCRQAELAIVIIRAMAAPHNSQPRTG